MIKPILFEYTRKICCVVNVIQRNRNKVEEEEEKTNKINECIDLFDETKAHCVYVNTLSQQIISFVNLFSMCTM